MLIFLVITTLICVRASASPISAGPPTVPTIIHTLVFGLHARNRCSDLRSLYDILRSCLFTIAACVYRAIHPSIPDPSLSFYGRLRVLVKIVFYALLAPEAMIWWALRQRFGATLIVEEVNKSKPELKWTQTHAQFLQMGGFGRKDDKRILYPSTFIDLLKDGHIDVDDLHLTEKEINDKSKGDILSKGLVAFQTSWFVFECFARLQQGLPLLELEVVTLAFATLNIITYALWWYKPLNVLCPIYIPIRSTFTTPATDISGPTDGSTAQDTSGVAEPISERQHFISGPTVTDIDRTDPPAGIIQRAKQIILNLSKDIHVSIRKSLSNIKQDIQKAGLWPTIWTRLIKNPFLTIVLPIEQLSDEHTIHTDATHVSMFYALAIPKDRDDLITIYSCLIGMLFGGIHFISWNSLTFPSSAQRILWRSSSIIMLIEPFLILTFDLFILLQKRTKPGSGKEMMILLVQYIFRNVAVFVGSIPYVLARICVLVVAFMTLRELPVDAFVDVSWSWYIPHF